MFCLPWKPSIRYRTTRGSCVFHSFDRLEVMGTVTNTRIDRPVSWFSAKAAQILARMRWARPSVASSRIRSFGLVIRTRPRRAQCLGSY